MVRSISNEFSSMINRLCSSDYFQKQAGFPCRIEWESFLPEETNEVSKSWRASCQTELGMCLVKNPEVKFMKLKINCSRIRTQTNQGRSSRTRVSFVFGMYSCT